MTRTVFNIMPKIPITLDRKKNSSCGECRFVNSDDELCVLYESYIGYNSSAESFIRCARCIRDIDTSVYFANYYDVEEK